MKTAISGNFDQSIYHCQCVFAECISILNRGRYCGNYHWPLRTWWPDGTDPPPSLPSPSLPEMRSISSFGSWNSIWCWRHSPSWKFLINGLQNFLVRLRMPFSDLMKHLRVNLDCNRFDSWQIASFPIWCMVSLALDQITDRRCISVIVWSITILNGGVLSKWLSSWCFQTASL